MSGKLKPIVHVLLFMLAFVIFYLGLGVGLQLNATLGTLLWVLAGIIALANLLWIFWGLLKGQR